MDSFPILNIKYSLKFEQQRIKYVLSKIDWFRNNGYSIMLPGENGISDINNETSLELLLSQAYLEYDESFYVTTETAIQDQWEFFMKYWPINETGFSGLNFLNSYDIYLTSYGVRGSYDLPDIIIVNVRLRDISQLHTILFHEMIHIAIEAQIRKYSISHWYKERLVDLLYKRLLPTVAFEQNLPKEVLHVDHIFEKYYGDMETIIKTIGTTLPKI